MAPQNPYPPQTEEAMTSGSDTHLRRDAAENRDRILAAARHLFAEYGVEPTSMRQIAQASEVGQGTLYRRYAHKGEVCQDLIAESGMRFFAATETYLEGARVDTPPLERLAETLARLVDFIEDHLPYLNAIGDACLGNRRANWFQSPKYAWLHATLSALLIESAGDDPDPTPVATFTADTILAVLAPDVYQFQREVRGLSSAEILLRVRRIYTPCPQSIRGAD